MKLQDASADALEPTLMMRLPSVNERAEGRFWQEHSRTLEEFNLRISQKCSVRRRGVCLCFPTLFKMYFNLKFLIWHNRTEKVPPSTLVPVRRWKPAARGDADRDTLISPYWLLLFSIYFLIHFLWTAETRAATGMCTNRVVCLLSCWRRLNRPGLVSGPLGGGSRIWCIFFPSPFLLLDTTKTLFSINVWIPYFLITVEVSDFKNFCKQKQLFKIKKIL